MSKWNDYASNVKGSGNGKFVNLKDGERVTFAIMGDPGEQHLLFPQGGGKPTEVKAGTPNAQVKIGLPIYDLDQKAPRLLQISVPTFKDLASLVGELGEDRSYRVSRTGSTKTDTRYFVTSIDRLTPEQTATIRRESPVDLVESGFTPLSLETQRQPGDEPQDASGIPF